MELTDKQARAFLTALVRARSTEADIEIIKQDKEKENGD